VDIRRCGALDQSFFKEFIFAAFIYFVTIGSIMIPRDEKIDQSRSSTNLATLCICLLYLLVIAYEYSKRFVQPLTQPVVQLVVQTKHVDSCRLYGRRAR